MADKRNITLEKTSSNPREIETRFLLEDGRSSSGEDNQLTRTFAVVGLDGDSIQKVDPDMSDDNGHDKSSEIPSKLSKFSQKEDIPPTTIPVSNLDDGTVAWDSQGDPKMPLNFAKARKWVIAWSLALITFMSPLSSSILSPAIADISTEFHNTAGTKGAFPVSIYLLGYAIGPLVLAPLSEVYGRRPILTGANIFFCLWQVGCALAPSLDSLIAFRFLAGVGGSGCLTLGGAIIGDLFPVAERGTALSVWMLGPLIGPTIGPLIGSFIAGTIGWRWALWIVLIPSAVITFVLAITLPETNHKVLIDHKIKRLEKSLGLSELRNCYEGSGPKLSQGAILRIGLLRPLKMLVLAPIITIPSLFVAFIYGTIYLMYNVLPPTFENEYGWPETITGLVYIPIGLGYLLGLAVFSKFSDERVIRMTKANGGVSEPEMRLPLMAYAGCICPITFFWFGWTAEYKVPWIVPIIGLVPIGAGIMGLFMPVQAYIVDAYPMYSASGLAAFVVLRSVVAAFLPLAGPALFDHLGLGWGNSVLGFICIAMIPIPLFIYKYGARLRKRYPLKL
ncbi:major facilitator superfamily domain-containing protein [Xylariomycetidae sp. FL2044]|nr:major facilitator superfamily domain-containing protein [Xylariomycetidae sp. FL2044]